MAKKITEKIIGVISSLFQKKNVKSEYDLFLDFLKVAREKLTNEIDKSQLNYLESIYKMAVSQQKKIEKKSPKVAIWISNDKEILDEKERKKEEAERNLPHPIDKKF